MKLVLMAKLHRQVSGYGWARKFLHQAENVETSSVEANMYYIFQQSIAKCSIMWSALLSFLVRDCFLFLFSYYSTMEMDIQYLKLRVA